jgi:hypothetical protein
MNAERKDDSFVRELRCLELARRLIAHQVRTRTISKMTGLSRDRLATLRQRLMVPDNNRLRGPPPRSIAEFLRTSHGRAEGAALASLLPFFKSPTSIGSLSFLEDGEQACDIYDAYLAYHPRSAVRFEELMLLKQSLTGPNAIALGLCRKCRGLIVNKRAIARRRTCVHCSDLHEE